MSASTVMGLALAPLFAAIHEVESGRGATSSNEYQIRMVYVDDVMRISGRRFAYSDVLSAELSREMMSIYWDHYARRVPGVVTYETLARIHNGGPDGWRKASTLGYWHKVRKAMIWNEMKRSAR